MEKQLRENVKESARQYYKEVYGSKKELGYIPPSGKVLGEEELCNMFSIVIFSFNITQNN